jgi:hypothetical protein
MKAFSITLLISLIGATAYAGKINLPARYVRTTYDVHLMTGLTSNEKSKDINVPSPLEITKGNDGEKDVLIFRALRKDADDESNEYETNIAYTNKATLITALSSLQKKSQQHDFKPEDGTDVLFEEEDLKLSCIRIMKPKKIYFEFVVDQRIYVLNDNSDIRKIVSLLNQL